MESVTVGRPKKRPTESGRKPVAVTIKGDPAWREWLERAASHCQTNVSGLISIAVAQYAKSLGFEEKPPKRLS